jgi:hypothetical protein
VITTREVYQCNACKSQTSLTAGTIFAATKLELKVWFQAMYHMTQSKQGISSVELGRRMGVRQRIAWAMKSKLVQVMMERHNSDDKRLGGRIEMDDAYLGGQRSGGKRGRGAPAKTPFVAAVETTDDGKPNPRCLALTVPLDENEPPHRRIVVQAIHPPPSPECESLLGRLATGPLLRRPAAAHRRRFRGLLSHWRAQYSLSVVN